MSRTTVTFNGVNLSNLYVVSGWYTPLLGRNFDTVDISGLDGQRFLGVNLAPRTITLSLTVKGTTLAERETAARALAATLAVDEPKPLTASFMDGRYYLAVPSSDSDLHRFVNADTFEVSFLVPDPVAYGELKTVSFDRLNSMGRVNVGGTYPTLPTISFPGATRSSTSGQSYFTVRVYDNSDYVSLTLDLSAVMSGSTTSRDLVVDCENRRYTVQGTERLLPLVSDWPYLAPNANARMALGTYSNCSTTTPVSVTFRERWL